MFSAIRKRLTYANVAVTVALVFAMSGGAYAASKYVITSTRQISPKVLKTLVGKAGPAGKNGTNGANGANGAPGPAGEKGASGVAGDNGTNGKDGVSVTSKTLTSSDTACNKAGGTEFTSSSGKTTACNGSPWVVGGLPKGASERGVWSVSSEYKEGSAGLIFVPISFNVPLAQALEGERVHYIGEEEGEGESKEAEAIKNHECEGTYQAPKAESGNLCVFLSVSGTLIGQSTIGVTSLSNPETRAAGAGISGAYLLAHSTPPEPPATEDDILDVGVWVVTG